MTQPQPKVTRVREEVNYYIKSLTPTPSPSPTTTDARIYRGKEFIPPEPLLTYHGEQQQLGAKYVIKKDGGYKFVLMRIDIFRVVDDQSQFVGVSCTDKGNNDDTVLMENCPLWWWLKEGLKYREDLLKIGFVESAFFDKLLYKNYQCLYRINDILYHQLIFYDSKRKPSPIRVKIVELDPDTHAGQNGDEFNIVMMEKRKRNGKIIKGGWTSEFRLDFDSKSWEINENILELEIARKAAKFGNRYYIENCMRLRNPPSDLKYVSPFWAKPEKYEELKNMTLIGFNGIYCKNVIYVLLRRVLEANCNTKSFNGFIWNVEIKNIRNNIYTFGEYANEYIVEYGVIPYLKSIKVTFGYNDEYIVMIFKQRIIEKEFDLKIIKTNDDGGNFYINSDVQLKYHRSLSRIFVNKFSIKLENRHFIKARKNGQI